MNFTDKFLEVDCFAYNNEESELYNAKQKESDLVRCKRLINPSRIESINEAIPLYDFREDNAIWVNITMFSGNEFIVDMPLTEFKKLLNNFNK